MRKIDEILEQAKRLSVKDRRRLIEELEDLEDSSSEKKVLPQGPAVVIETYSVRLARARDRRRGTMTFLDLIAADPYRDLTSVTTSRGSGEGRPQVPDPAVSGEARTAKLTCPCLLI